MKIEKNGKMYTVQESEKQWNLKYTIENLTIDYTVSKELCTDKKTLFEYIMNEPLF